MIPFFRKIRKKMADDNRPLKYARYAFGEIILVVIGILIALQINTWNADKKARKLEYLTLTELKKNIETDLVAMDLMKISLNSRIRACEIVIQSLSSDQPYHDSLNIHFGMAMVYDDMDFHKGIYESIKISGNQLIDDNSLRFAINNYYDYSVQDMEDGIREIRDDFYNYMLTYLREDFKYYRHIDSKAEPRDFEALKQDMTYKLSLGIFMDVKKMNLRILINTIQASTELIEKIDQRLSKIEH
ncbi:hypothetical protein LCM02_04925 [Lutimonas saemankumensis]|uniref:DUF6090 family protein n=1 Tax=Lutimonas saemankumensis TaxID=483016 RepID=UPI001CD20D91|nr:DUF6090 family protein [Lutimonas saemankumensis]MCA0931785.1 hypothetical protein [Lutimonas saemankumensis]